MTAHITARVGYDDRPGYQQVTICAGPEGDTHVMVGRLIMRDAEAAELVARITAKAHPHTQECLLLADKLRVARSATRKARSNADRASTGAARARSQLQAVRAELHQLQGQNTQTEVNFNAYAESAILQENELRGQLLTVEERNTELGRRYGAVSKLHPLDQTGGTSVCTTCRLPYPCPTLRTLDESTEGSL